MYCMCLRFTMSINLLCGSCEHEATIYTIPTNQGCRLGKANLTCWAEKNNVNKPHNMPSYTLWPRIKYLSKSRNQGASGSPLPLAFWMQATSPLAPGERHLHQGDSDESLYWWQLSTAPNANVAFILMIWYQSMQIEGKMDRIVK